MKPQCRHTKDVLPNGLRLVTVELPHLHTAAIVVYAKVGSRYETPEDNGLSHFLEHMLFRGSDGHPSSFALNLAIESLGGTLYAETGRDYSLYQISLQPELLADGMAILADIFSAPAFTQIELERQIVLEEINEDLDEDGNDVNLDDLARRTAFPDHPLGQKITGPVSNVARFGVDDCRRHFARFYGAENLLLCVSGPVRREEVLAVATRLTARIPRGSAAESATPAEPSGRPRFAYVDNPGAQTAVQVLFRALPEVHPDFVTLQTLMRVLDDGMSTRLHYTLCDQMGLAYYVNGALEPFHDAALVVVEGAAAHAKVGELLGHMLAILGRFRDEPVAAQELVKAKRRYRFDLAAAFDDADAMAGWFGGTELFYAPAEFDTKVARMDAVTADDIQRVAQEIFRRDRLVVAASGALAARQLGKVKKTVEEWR
jgi:predicted Zn-dependent peptidase